MFIVGAFPTELPLQGHRVARPVCMQHFPPWLCQRPRPLFRYVFVPPFCRHFICSDESYCFFGNGWIRPPSSVANNIVYNNGNHGEIAQLAACSFVVVPLYYKASFPFIHGSIWVCERLDVRSWSSSPAFRPIDTSTRFEVAAIVVLKSMILYPRLSERQASSPPSAATTSRSTTTKSTMVASQLRGSSCTAAPTTLRFTITRFTTCKTPESPSWSHSVGRSTTTTSRTASTASG